MYRLNPLTGSHIWRQNKYTLFLEQSVMSQRYSTGLTWIGINLLRDRVAPGGSLMMGPRGPPRRPGMRCRYAWIGRTPTRAR